MQGSSASQLLGYESQIRCDVIMRQSWEIILRQGFNQHISVAAEIYKDVIMITSGMLVWVSEVANKH